MKAEINNNGELFIIAENTLETYALTRWWFDHLHHKNGATLGVQNISNELMNAMTKEQSNPYPTTAGS